MLYRKRNIFIYPKMPFIRSKMLDKFEVQAKWFSLLNSTQVI